jgi:hypothetical protein
LVGIVTCRNASGENDWMLFVAAVDHFNAVPSLYYIYRIPCNWPNSICEWPHNLCSTKAFII